MIDKKPGLNSPAAIASVVFAVILWSTSFAAIKAGMNDFPPISFAALRFIFASIILVAIYLVKPNKEKVARKDFPILLIGGLLGITLLFLLHNLAMKITTSADANIVVACYPIIMITIDLIGKRAKTNLMQLLGVAISIIGVIIILGKIENTGQNDRLLGNLLVFCAGISWGFYNLVTKKVVGKYSAFTVTYWQTMFGMLGLVLLSLTEISRWKVPSSSTINSALYLAIACSIGAYLLYGIGLKKLEPRIAVNLMNLQPGFGVVFAVLLLRESITVVQIAGGLLIIAGVILSIKNMKSKTPSDAVPMEASGGVEK